MTGVQGTPPSQKPNTKRTQRPKTRENIHEKMKYKTILPNYNGPSGFTVD
jgi:hypothetical protein